ncbi:MAG TPA: hypothetical protein VIU82_10365 [Bosea sp. (in: a-proteobacteria)]
MIATNDRQRAYLARGRRFRSTPAEALSLLFVAGYSAWVSTFPRRDDSVDDVQAEFELRGEPVPFDLVAPQIEEIMALTSELMGFAGRS